MFLKCFFFLSFNPSVISTGLVKKSPIINRNYTWIIMYNNEGIAEILQHTQPSQTSNVIIPVDIFLTVAEGSAGINRVGGYLFDDEGKYLDCARTLFI